MPACIHYHRYRCFFGAVEKGIQNPASPAQTLLTSAQVVAYYFPKLVDLHNYAAANAVRQKVYNWNTLNEKVK